MKNIKETINQLQELRTWSNYVNKERFISYAEAKYPLTNREAESLWRVWIYITDMNWYKLQEVSDEKMELVVSIAREVYDSVCNGAHVHWTEESPKTPRWRVYYRKGERGKIKQMDINLREKEYVIKYALLLQQEGIEAGFSHFFQTLLTGQQVQLLYDLNLVHFHWHCGAVIKFDLRHFFFLPLCFSWAYYIILSTIDKADNLDSNNRQIRWRRFIWKSET